MGPPSSGALTISQILGMIENYNIAELGFDNPNTWRIIGDASRLAFADRSIYMADSDFINVPIKELINKDYLYKRARLLNSKNKIEEIKPGNIIGKSSLNWGNYPFPDLQLKAIVDKYGNALSMTTTIGLFS